MQKEITAFELPSSQSQKEIEKIQDEQNKLPIYYIVTKVLFPVFSQASVKRDMTIATIAVMRAALSLRDYQIEHGAYPESLAELQASGGWPMPENPFTGKSV